MQKAILREKIFLCVCSDSCQFFVGEKPKQPVNSCEHNVDVIGEATRILVNMMLML